MNKPYDNLINEKQHTAIIQVIIDYFASERDEQIGVIAAESLLDALLPSLIPTVYNHALEDVKKVLKDQIAMAEGEISLLTKEEP